MGGVRIRWRQAAKLGLAGVGLLAALQLAPALLRAPEPPPLGADVGLPRPAQSRGSFVAPRATKEPRDPKRAADQPSRGSFVAPRATKEPRAREPLPPGVISSVPHPHRRAHPRRRAKPTRQPAATPPAPIEAAPPPLQTAPAPLEYAPAPAVEPAPSPAPPAPGDGSEEFAPH